MMKVTQKQIILLGVKSALSLFALFVITVIIHEGAHYITALILRIPIAHFSLFDPNYFAPMFISASKEYTAGMTIVSYAGGIFTGIILLSVLIFRWNWFKESLYRWFLGLYLATFEAWQISQGILEGAFHHTYILNATKLLFSPTHYVGYASAFIGMALYWLFMPRLKRMKM
ncbi:hypothetical protein ACFLXU_05515 [Chloroflexota bacterium]